MSLLIVFMLSGGCGKQERKPFRFELMNSEYTSVDFTNTVEPSPDFNILNYLYFYDGGGVSIGDINGDGLPDIYLTANKKANRLYLNEGNFQFKNITYSAGVAGQGDWATGTTMADVNGDGLLDIYACYVNYLSKKGRNQLFINNGDSTFTEKAEEYGLAFKGYSQHAAFFDMENDGDLDMYLLNHSVHTKKSFRPSSNRSVTDSNAGDRLYRNDGGKFTDVTHQAGIYSSILGYGLAVSVSDINGDNYQDIYISNDFHENDYLYINQHDGTFRDVIGQSLQHTSRASMGSDIADINNDLKPDIAVLDMLPNTEKSLKTSVSSEPYEVYSIQRDYGYHPQLIRNTLQLNLGTISENLPVFSEIAPYAAVHATDWSWSPLLFDMDNDGLKDLFVSNGIYRRPNDMDYLIMTRSEKVQRSLNKEINEQNISWIDTMPHVKKPNFAFHNNGDLTFTNKADEWGIGRPSYSHGAAYGDLDNDGDLDLVINNVNSKTTLYQNKTTEQDKSSYLTIRLKARAQNTMAIGSKVIVTAGERKQMAHLMPTRGFQSSVDPRIFFGLGDAQQVDSLRVIWPDGNETIKTNIPVNRQLTIHQQKSETNPVAKSSAQNPILRQVNSPLTTDFIHNEDVFNGFNQQPLMPYQLSNEGPAIAVGDVNGDSLKDFYIGGAQWQSGSLYIQDKKGQFKKQKVPAFQQDAIFEDTDAVFFDANNDGALDLYVVSGGNEHTINSQKLYDRFYLNNGKGQFARSRDAFPDFGANGSTVVPFDYDRDGDTDIFVGSRSVPNNYGITPHSYLFRNEGDGTFKEITDDAAPGLKALGMVSDAVSADINGDNLPDLVVAGDWMPITIFINEGGQLTKSEKLSSGNGFWQTVYITDMGSDGDMDILAGNFGKNTTLNASEKEPLIMYTGDFNGDGAADPIIGRTKGDSVYPIVGRDKLLQTIRYLRPKFPTYQSFAGKTLAEIFDPEQLEKADKKNVNELASLYFENTGNGNFKKHVLPEKVQFAPVYAFNATDFDGDGIKDVLAGGNLYKVLPVYGGPYDASFGWLLIGQKNGSFSVLNPKQSGFFIDGEIREIVQIADISENPLIMIGINGKKPQFVKP